MSHLWYIYDYDIQFLNFIYIDGVQLARFTEKSH